MMPKIDQSSLIKCWSIGYFESKNFNRSYLLTWHKNMHLSRFLILNRTESRNWIRSGYRSYNWSRSI